MEDPKDFRTDGGLWARHEHGVSYLLYVIGNLQPQWLQLLSRLLSSLVSDSTRHRLPISGSRCLVSAPTRTTKSCSGKR